MGRSLVNLTILAPRVEVATAAVNAGKQVWTEKPFSLDRESGLRLLKTAHDAGSRLATAPDTFLSAGLQIALRVIQGGDIGTPLTAMTTFQTPGPDCWHPNPSFLFQYGAGPLFDMGPYYLTALAQAFGSIRKVAAVGSKAKEVRVVGSGPEAGEEFSVEVPAHVSAMRSPNPVRPRTASSPSNNPPRVRMGFRGDYRNRGHDLPAGPNYFTGDIRLWRAGDEDWTTVPAIGSANEPGMGPRQGPLPARRCPRRATGELPLPRPE